MTPPEVALECFGALPAALEAQVREAYETSFPEAERVPFEDLLAFAASHPEAARFAIVREGGAPRGFLYLVDFQGRPDLLYIAYFAIFAACRGRGIGSAALRSLARSSLGRRCLLDIEKPDPAAPNARERARRLAFYERLGWRRSGFEHAWDGISYETLGRGGAVTESDTRLIGSEFWDRVSGA